MKKLLSISLMSLSFFILSDDEPTFPGLISSDVFNMGNGMVMHVERRNSCNQDGTPKHFHPAAGHLYTCLMALHNLNRQVIGKNIIKMNIGLKDLIGSTVARKTHLHCLKELVKNFSYKGSGRGQRSHNFY